LSVDFAFLDRTGFRLTYYDQQKMPIKWIDHDWIDDLREQKSFVKIR